MADVDFDDFEGGHAAHAASGGRASHLINLAGAACSVALVIGLGIWGYQLAVRDVTGVPVMRAMSGPLRVAHANPGGDIASHQGLSVNAVAAAGTAAPMPEQLVLAPRPVELAFDDAPGLMMAAQAGEVAVDPVLPAAPSATAEVLALADAVSEGAAPLSPLADLPQATEEMALGDVVTLPVEGALPADAALDADVALAEPPVMVRTLRPQPRPGSRAEPLPTDVQSVIAAAPVEVDPTTLAVGTRLVQLGAFDDAAGARGEWVRLAAQFGDLMAGKAMVVQAAQSGGRTFYRLRAHGFGGEDDARRFCSAFLAENAACILVAHR